MSVEHLKKQAKNTQRLLEAFTGAPKGSIKLSAAQEFVAQSHGYPDWHSALSAEAPPRPASAPPPQDLWMLTYEERANDNDELISSELRLIEGVADAVGIFWHTQAEFDQRQDSPGIPDKFTLDLVACDEPNALSSKALQLNYAAGRRHIKIHLFPVDPIITMLDGPYTQPNEDIRKILDSMHGSDDMPTLLAAAKIPYNFLHADLTAYHDEHPTKGLFDSFNDHLAKVLRDKAKTQGPRECFWDCQTWRLDRWRFRLQFYAAMDVFYFDVFDEGGSLGSFTEMSIHSALKRRASGWTVGPFKGKAPRLLPLNGISDSDMATLRTIAADCGIGFVIDGMTELSPLPSDTAPAQQKFLRWAAEKNPGILAGGKYDPAKK